MTENKYPIGGYAPGNYFCKCAICGLMFRGDKRAVECEPCAVEAKEEFDKLSPPDQDKLIKENIELFNNLYQKTNK